MTAPTPQGTRSPASPGGMARDTSGQAGIIGIGLAAVLTFALAQGSWQWFATYIGVTLLAVIFSFYRLPTWTGGFRPAHALNLIAFSLVVGLCVAITVAPVLQRTKWLFPMPGSRSGCPELGRFEVVQEQAALSNLMGHDSPVSTYTQQFRGHQAVADCLAATTTLWLPAYAAGAALVVGVTTWCLARARMRDQPAPRPGQRSDRATVT
ncbi:hypothetical protein ACWCP6_27295 [Streptomyces sp. NPDC002004]